MKPHHFTMLGLVFNMVGAFLVAVEAIKLDNIRALREKVFRRAYRYTLSPRIIFVGEDPKSSAPQKAPDVPSERYPGLFMGLHYVAGLLVILVVNRLLNGWVFGVLARAGLWIMNQPWYLSVPVAIGFVLYGIVAGLWVVGEFVHEFLTLSTTLCIRVLEFVEARTPDGTVGLLGFLFLLVGFSLQMYGVYRGGSNPLSSVPNSALQPTPEMPGRG